MSLPSFIHSRLHGDGGYRHVLKLAIPLILSTGAISLQHFIDRMFLTWHSPEAIAAAMPAGILSFNLMAFVIGITGYASTFVAQYHGAGQYRRIGPVVWQGLYIAAAGGLVFLFVIPLARPLFTLIGHAPQVVEYEIVYFQILCAGAFPGMASSAMGAYYSGRGQTWPVMWVNVAATAVNVVLNYLLIFGKFGFPAMGIAGAAIGTVISGTVMMIIYGIILFRPGKEKVYALISGWRPDRELMKRLLRFGAPSGFQFFIDMFAFSAFLLLIGRLGTSELAASNIAFNVNTFAFMPMIGMGIAISVLTGQYIGMGSPGRAKYAVYSGLHLTVTYMGTVAMLFFFVPDMFIWFYAVKADPVTFAPLREYTVVLLKFVAVFSVFDALNIIFASALKGAGDTWFIMVMVGVLSLTLFTIPVALVVFVFGGSLYLCWTIGTAYIIILGLSFFTRFRNGAWMHMRVIEEISPDLRTDIPGPPHTT